MINYIRKFKTLFFKSDSNRNVLTLMTGSVAGHVVTICALPVLTRIYSPGDFGILALYLSVVSIGSVFCGGRYELSLPLPKEKEDASNLLVIALAVVCIVSVISVPVFITNRGIWEPFVKERTMEKFFVFVPFGLFFQSAYVVLTYWFLRHKAFVLESKSRVLLALVTVVTRLVAGFMETGSVKFGLLWGHVLGQAAAMLFLLVFIAGTEFHFDHVSFTSLKRLAIRYKKFPLLSVWDVVFNRMAFHIPVWIITHFFGISTAGFFSMARNVYNMPTSFVRESISRVFFRRLTEERHNAGDSSQIVKRTFITIALVSFAPFVAIAVCAPFLFGPIFGEQWHEAGKFVIWLLPLAWARFVVSPVSTTLIVYERQGRNLVWQIGLACLTLFAYYGFSNLAIGQLVLTSSSILAGWYVVLFIIVIWVARKYR